MNAARSQHASLTFGTFCGSDALAALPRELNRVGPLLLEGMRC
jgi:hypothetical protein